MQAHPRHAAVVGWPRQCRHAPWPPSDPIVIECGGTRHGWHETTLVCGPGACPIRASPRAWGIDHRRFTRHGSRSTDIIPIPRVSSCQRVSSAVSGLLSAIRFHDRRSPGDRMVDRAATRTGSRGSTSPNHAVVPRRAWCERVGGSAPVLGSELGGTPYSPMRILGCDGPDDASKGKGFMMRACAPPRRTRGGRFGMARG